MLLPFPGLLMTANNFTLLQSGVDIVIILFFCSCFTFLGPIILLKSHFEFGIDKEFRLMEIVYYTVRYPKV